MVSQVLRGSNDAKGSVSQEMILANLRVIQQELETLEDGGSGGGGVAFSYNFSTSTVEEDPGAGAIRFNADNINATTEIYIDVATSAGRNIGLWIAHQGSGQIAFMSSDSNGTAFGLFDITLATNNSDTYYTLTVTPVENLGVMPADGEEILVMFSKETITMTAQDVLDMDVARFDVDFNLIDKLGTIRSNLLTAATIAALPAAATKSGKIYIITSPTPAAAYSDASEWHHIGTPPIIPWADFPAANAVPVGTRIRVDASSFSGTYKRALGPVLETDGTRWRPYNGRQRLASMVSQLATPFSSCTFSGSADVLFDIPTNFSLPALFLHYVGQGLHIKAWFVKTGANADASTFRIKMGKNNNAVTADIIGSGTTTAAAARQYHFDVEAKVTVVGPAGGGVPDPTDGKFLTSTAQPNAANTSLIFDRTQYLDTDLVNYVVFTGDGTAAATGGLVAFSIDLID